MSKVEGSCSLAIRLFAIFLVGTFCLRTTASQAAPSYRILVEGISWSPDGSKIAVAAGPFTCDDPDNRDPDAYAATIVDVDTQQIEKRFRGSTCALVDIAWSPDGTKLATSSFAGNEAFIWDVATETRLIRSSIRAEIGVAVVWNPDSTLIASIANGGRHALIWDATTGAVLFGTPDHAGANGYVTALAWSPDGSRIATSALDGSVLISSAASQQTLLTLTYTDELYWAAWSPDGSKIAGGSRDGTVQIWDANSGELLNVWRGHMDSVDVVVWSPDSTRIASGSLDGTICVWDVRSGQIVDVIPSTLGAIVDVAWSPVGDKLAYIGKESGSRLVPVEIIPAPTESLPTFTP